MRTKIEIDRKDIHKVRIFHTLARLGLIKRLFVEHLKTGKPDIWVYGVEYE